MPLSKLVRGEDSQSQLLMYKEGGKFPTAFELVFTGAAFQNPSSTLKN